MDEDNYYNRKELAVLTDKIEKGERFSVLSFGDGEWSFVFDRENHHELSERELWTEEIWVGLLQALNLSRREDCYLTTTIGTYGEKGYEELHLKAEKYLEIMELEPKELTDARVFYDTLQQIVRGNLQALADFISFLKVLRKKKVVLVGDAHLAGIIKEGLLPDAEHILIPEGKASKNIHNICYDVIMHKKPAYYFLSCGMATGAILKDLHSRLPKSSFIDVGALWDFILMEGDRAEPHWKELKAIIKRELDGK